MQNHEYNVPIHTVLIPEKVIFCCDRSVEKRDTAIRKAVESEPGKHPVFSKEGLNRVF
ncbi:hypothetical protein P4E94_08175 [Pontiellaceae bacterium B12219]|nr:hypothetical protein [Pontiellaceae bacterium B12219]